MATKPEPSAAAVPNVVVYVSNDNFAQAYAIGQPGACVRPFYPHGRADCDRCDSAAESSCSSLSSDEARPHEMVAFEAGAGGRVGGGCGGGVVFALGEQQLNHCGSVAIGTIANQQVQPQFISVPYGWKRIYDSGTIIYISPSNTALSSAEQVKDYLLTPGTCKCGLECPFKYDSTFSFDPKVASKPWTMSPDTNPGDLTKLCNHKRKMIAMTSLDCKPPDPTNIKLRKDCHTKKAKRKIASPYPNCVPTNQLFNRPQEKPQYPKDQWPHSPTSPSHRLQYQPDNFLRYPEQPPPPGRPFVFNPDGTVTLQPNISQPPAPHAPPPPNPQIHFHHQHIIGPNGQVLSVQGPALGAPGPGQQRVFVNQPSEPSGPGRPGAMLPQPRFFGGPYGAHANGYDAGKAARPGFAHANGFRPPHQLAGLGQMMQAPALGNGHQKWPPSRPGYERVPPLHQHNPPPAANVWHEEVKRKKVKVGKGGGKGRPYHAMECQAACPNIDVRQIAQNENGRVVVNHLGQQQGVSNGASPSFMEDPSGYLAQQTALLNNTINRQTGCIGMACNSPVTSSANPSPTNEVPLPSNVVIQAPPTKHPPAPHRHPTQKHHHPHYTQMIVDSSDHNCPGCPSHPKPRPPSHPSCDDPVTSSTYSDKHPGLPSPDSRPIQGGTVSTSNVSPLAPDPPHTPTPPHLFTVYNQHGQPHQVHQSRDLCTSSSHYVTTMASGRTSGSNTITSVLAGRAPTATVSIGTPPPKSPLEMVQSVVSSIQVPNSQPQLVKPGHIYVSSNGQLIMANPPHQSSMPPPPPKLVPTSMPPLSVSPMITNVTGAVSQVIPTAQQVLGPQTVLVNALPAPFVLQSMTMDGGMIPQLVTGNVIQHPIHPHPISPETKKKGKKRKMPAQTVANMLHIAQQNPVVMSQQGFPQQIQMAHSPQPVMQALTIVPSKNGGPPQIVMNGGGQPMVQPAQLNLLQPVNLINGVQNFPTIQQFILPNLGGMVMNPDGTATLLQDTSNMGMQLQFQNVNGQNVLTPVQNGGMFNGGQSILPAGMVIRAQGGHQKILQQQQHSPQFLSPNGGFVVNGGQFGGQLSPLVASVSPSGLRAGNGGEFIQCGQVMVPVSGTGQPNATFVQQNTTIVQHQQTTMVAGGGGARGEPFGGGEGKAEGYRQSVATQTAAGQNAGRMVTTYCQTSTMAGGSPPDTTTHSPVGGQSPHGADTTTHSGSTDEGLSPAPSNSSVTCDSGLAVGRQQACTMAMVHCVSSSEPDSAELGPQGADNEWSRLGVQQKNDLLNEQNGNRHQLHFKKSSSTNPTHLAYAESSTMVTGLQYIEQMKAQEAVISSHNFDKIMQQKRKSSDTLLVMETHHMHSSLFDEEDKGEKSLNEACHKFVVGDLVWGPTKTHPAWPGKIVELIDDNAVTVKWFGTDKLVTKLDKSVLQTLTEGLDAHHQAHKKTRTSRKLNANLEKAIQEAMTELDKQSEIKEPSIETQKPTKLNRTSGRSLRNR